MSIFLGDAIFWTAVACCTVAEFAIVRSALVAHSSAISPTAGKLSLQRWTEVGWTILPAIALAVVLALTWRAVRDARAGAGETPAAHAGGVAS